MSMTLFLMATKAVGDIATGMTGKHYAKKTAKAKRKTAEAFHEFNKKQLEDSYMKSFSGAMSKYIDTRIGITEQYNNVQSNLNIQAYQSGVNLADSSYTNDSQAQLDNEFNKNLQNTYENLVNQTADIVLNKTVSDMKLEQQFNNQMYDIKNTLNQVEQAMNDKIGSSMMNFASELGKDYSTYSSKKNLLGQQGSVKDYVSNDLLNFKF